MANNDIDIKSIHTFVKRSGFLLELEVLEIFERCGWATYSSAEYSDIDEGKDREIDLIAIKEINGLRIHIIIECKYSDDNVWIFAPKAAREYSRRYASPRNKPYIIKALSKEQLNEFKNYLFELPLNLDGVHEAKNYLVCKKDGKKADGDIIKPAIFQLVKAYLYYSFQVAESHDNSRNIFLLFLVTNNPMFVLGKKSTEVPIQCEYLTYAQKYRVEPKDGHLLEENESTFPQAYFGSPSYSKSVKEAKKNRRKAFLNYAIIQDEKYHIEVIRDQYLESHLKKIEGIISKFPRNPSEYWKLEIPKSESVSHKSSKKI